MYVCMYGFVCCMYVCICVIYYCILFVCVRVCMNVPYGMYGVTVHNCGIK